jgi:hypothetical protein
MVTDTGKTLCPGAFKPVNLPELLAVKESDSGEPEVVRTPLRQKICAIEDRWRIDDEWWRNEPVSRMYYAILFRSGQRLVIYKDLIQGKWYRQKY